MEAAWLETINRIVACPHCRASLRLNDSQDTKCVQCQETYRWLSYTWDFIPSSWKTSSSLWPTWEHLQANGLTSYVHDPAHNLAVGPREDCMDFSRFCKFDGLVLDIGCGPQAWPTYFVHHSDSTQFVGVDPLAGGIPAEYLQFRALGEYLPFVDRSFDHVVFATSLDHFIDPIQVLREARRVCRTSGFIDIWVGDKRPGAPQRAISPSWYTDLRKPDQAEDVFHLKRLGPQDLRQMLDQLCAKLVEEESHKVDEYSTNYFFKMQVLA